MTKYAHKSTNLRELLVNRGRSPSGHPDRYWIKKLFDDMLAVGVKSITTPDALYHVRRKLTDPELNAAGYGYNKELERAAGVLLRKYDEEAAEQLELDLAPTPHTPHILSGLPPKEDDVPETVMATAMRKALEESTADIYVDTEEGDTARESTKQNFRFSFDPNTGPSLHDVIRAVDILGVKIHNISISGR